MMSTNKKTLYIGKLAVPLQQGNYPHPNIRQTLKSIRVLTSVTMVVHDTLSIDLRPLASSSIHSPQPSSSPLSSPDSIPPPSVIPIPANADGGDPYLLASRVMPADHIRDIRKRRDISHNKDIASFYEEQNEEIRRMLSKDDDSDGDADSKRSKTRAKAWAEKVAIQGSLIANIALSILQLYAAISSGSMSLFATMADSIFDPFSNFILLLAHRTSVKWDVDKYPSGKARMETIGNIVYAFLMATVSVVLIVSITSLSCAVCLVRYFVIGC